MDPLTLFGFIAVTAMLVCYALEERGAGYVLGFAGACALGSIYGFLQGAWPFGVVEAIWAVVAGRRWVLRPVNSSACRIFSDEPVSTSSENAPGERGAA